MRGKGGGKSDSIKEAIKVSTKAENKSRIKWWIETKWETKWNRLDSPTSDFGLASTSTLGPRTSKHLLPPGAVFEHKLPQQPDRRGTVAEEFVVEFAEGKAVALLPADVFA